MTAFLASRKSIGRGAKRVITTRPEVEASLAMGPGTARHSRPAIPSMRAAGLGLSVSSGAAERSGSGEDGQRGRVRHPASGSAGGGLRTAWARSFRSWYCRRSSSSWRSAPCCPVLPEGPAVGLWVAARVARRRRSCGPCHPPLTASHRLAVEDDAVEALDAGGQLAAS